MNHLFKNTYKTKSTRLRAWDYSSSGYYFITICTKDKVCYFGEMRGKQMFLSSSGEIVKRVWFDLPNHYQIMIDEFCVMPNHIHGIIVIQNGVETHHDASLQRRLTKRGDIRARLPVIMGRLKMQSSKQIHNIHSKFAWQPRYYDHIIRNEEDLHRIREYIRFNPLKWNEDKENPTFVLKNKLPLGNIDL